MSCKPVTIPIIITDSNCNISELAILFLEMIEQYIKSTDQTKSFEFQNKLDL